MVWSTQFLTFFLLYIFHKISIKTFQKQLINRYSLTGSFLAMFFIIHKVSFFFFFIEFYTNPKSKLPFGCVKLCKKNLCATSLTLFFFFFFFFLLRKLVEVRKEMSAVRGSFRILSRGVNKNMNLR